MTTPPQKITHDDERSFVAARTRTTADERPSRTEETRTERLSRHARRAALYAAAFSAVALFVLLVALIAANARQVRLDWLAGSSRASLVWIIVVAAAIGWLLGIATSVIFRWRTRRGVSA